MTLSKNRKILILTVDIDDDLGQVGITTPVIGYKNVLDSAIDFALKKPQDSDVNSLFYALNLYTRLSREGENVEIAVLAGHRTDYVKASFRISEQLEEIKKSTGFTHVLFVSDGVSDERILPIITSVSPVIGVERVVVEQSRSIEETYILFGRYLKKAFSEQPYARIFLGIPGIIILLAAALSLVGLSKYIWDTILLLIGSFLFIRGFGLVNFVVNSWKRSPIVGIMYLISLGIFIFIPVFFLIALYVVGYGLEVLIGYADLLILSFLIASILFFGGRIFDKLIAGTPERIWRDSILLLPVILFSIFLKNILFEVRKTVTSGGNVNLVDVLLAHSYLLNQAIVIIVIVLAVTILFILFESIMKPRTG